MKLAGAHCTRVQREGERPEEGSLGVVASVRLYGVNLSPIGVSGGDVVGGGAVVVDGGGGGGGSCSFGDDGVVCS